MKKLVIILQLFFSFLIYAQENYSLNSLLIKLDNQKWEVSKLNLKENKFSILKLDDILETNNISRILPIGNPKQTYTFQLEFSQNIDVQNFIKLVNVLDEVEYIEPDYNAEGGGKQCNTEMTTPSDPLFNRQWGIYNNGTFFVSGMPFTSENDADVDLDLVWDLETGDPNMLIAVPDTGFNVSHPELSGRIWTNPNEIPNDGIDNDANGYIDDINGWDFVNNDNNATDDHGHGTNCSGILLASGNNGIGYAGVNWNSKLIPLKVLDSNNSGQYSWMANSIYYAVNKGAKVISMSIGGTGNSTTLFDAVQYAVSQNVVFVACMMNFNNSTTYYPAGYTSTLDMIAVGSTDSDDDRTAPFFWSATSGSNYGNHITVVAPGNYIYGLNYISNTNYNTYWGGTSQATPLVAGVASLLLSENPNLTPAQIKNIIKNTAQDQVGATSEDTAGWDMYMGWGRVNAFQAFQTLGQLESNTNSQEFEYINPINNNNLIIHSKGNYTGNYKLKVYNLEGKLMKNAEIKIEKGTNSIDFDLPAGTYIVSFENTNYKKVIKIINN